MTNSAWKMKKLSFLVHVKTWIAVELPMKVAAIFRPLDKSIQSINNSLKKKVKNRM